MTDIYETLGFSEGDASEAEQDFIEGYDDVSQLSVEDQIALDTFLDESDEYDEELV